MFTAGAKLVGLLRRAVRERPEAVLLFWGVPAILSSLQLFAFGTWLPHRRGEQPFADRHRARSSGFGWFASLLTCFHFGYHHEHHDMPHLPWWRLPARWPRRVPLPVRSQARRPRPDR